MPRKWVMLLTFAGMTLAGLAAIAPVAGDARGAPAADEKSKSPLQKIMVKMDDQIKSIQKVASSPARFKKSGGDKDIMPAVEELIKLGKDTRKFPEPAEALKKPMKTWEDYTDQYIAASGDLGKVAKKKDYQELRKALKQLDLSCSNCHGLFRPKTGGDEFGP